MRVDSNIIRNTMIKLLLDRFENSFHPIFQMVKREKKKNVGRQYAGSFLLFYLAYNVEGFTYFDEGSLLLELLCEECKLGRFFSVL